MPLCRDVLTDSHWTFLNLCRYKNDHEINGSYSRKHLVTPQNDPEQSLYKCRGVSSKRPLYSKQSASFKTRNLRECNRALRLSLNGGHCFISDLCFSLNSVVLKRRVLLAISGCILFGITVTILGCIILRAFRKPGFSFHLRLI